MSSSLSKRKLDDYADEIFPLSPTRMRKDQIPLSTSPPLSPTTTRSSFGSDLQFFVRTFTHNTLVLHADPGDTVESIHYKIQKITGIPVNAQRLIYRGKQLQSDQTLVECDVQKDTNMHLVGRMRSTEHPLAWQLLNDVVSSIFYLVKNNSLPLSLSSQRNKTIRSMLLEFLSMTPKDREKASEHLQILNASSAPEALVILYVNVHKPNKRVGEEAIRDFIMLSKTILPSSNYDLFIPIVLEFCRLLKRSTGITDRMYCLCRSTLAAMMESFDLKGRELIWIKDISPFVSELAAMLSSALVSSLQPDFTLEWSLDDVIGDFSKLMLAMRSAIVQHNLFLCPIEVSLINGPCKAPLFYPDEIATLHGIFEDLLFKLDICLGKVDEHLKVAGTDGSPLNVSCHYLAILKELNSISKPFSECKELFWETMKRRKDAVNYLILRDAKRYDDHKWIIHHKEVTIFESRRHLTMLLLPEVKDEFEELHEMLIDRANLLSESFEYIGRADPDSLRAGLFMEFKNEEATGPGILREWFLVVCQAIFNPQNALFVACPGDRRRFFPNPASKVDPLHLDYFKFSGRIIALALMHKIQIGIVFDRVFYLLLAEQEITLEDIRYADPYIYRSCKQILSMDPDVVEDALGLTFVYEIDELGSRKVTELCNGGKDLVVNSENRGQYVDSLIQHRFVVSIAEQVEHFAIGFTDIMGCRELKRSFFRCLDPEDLDAILYGSEKDICVDDWRAHTEYHGFEETDAQISWFWDVLESMTPDQKKILLIFWTSIKFLPVEGFRGLASHLFIYKTTDPDDHLPSSHTCFYRICFPAYPSLSVMRDRLHIITQEHIGCSFGTW